MFSKYVPNGSQKCTLLENNEQFDITITKILEDATRSNNQYNVFNWLYAFGYFQNKDYAGKLQTLDNYITRCQQKLKYFTNVHIYYGQIGKNNEYGYYLQVNP